jgi:hypothetical protein
MSRLGSADPVLPARTVLEILYHPYTLPASFLKFFIIRPPKRKRPFSGPVTEPDLAVHLRTIHLDPFFLLVLCFSPSIPLVEDWPIGTDSYPLFPIYTPVFPRACNLLATCLLAGLLKYSSTLKMEAIRSSETSGTTQRTTRGHIPEEDALQNHRCENLKSYKCHKTWTWVTCMISIALAIKLFQHS